MSEEQYHSASHCKYLTQYHIIWCPKFRFSILQSGAYDALKNVDNAMLNYTKAIQLNPNMTDAYYNRAKIILSDNNATVAEIKNAMADLETALSQDEKFVDALFAMAAAYKKLGDYHKSLEYLEKLLEISPDAIHAKALKKLLLTKYIV